jgi:hypothetical protein
VLNALRRRAHPLARIGCAAIGTVYILIGGVALIALSGHLIEYADEDRIGYLIKRLPGGAILLWAVAAGAAAWVAWRAIQALTDPYDVAAGWRGIVKRTGVALSGLAYAFVSYSAAHAALTPAPRHHDAPEQRQQALIGHVLHWPAGAWIIGAAGACLIAVGLIQFWLVVRRAYTSEIQMRPVTRWAKRTLHLLASYGYSARGVILCVIGYFFVHGAAMHDPSLVGDTDTAFDFIGGGIVGNTAFAIVALGTVAFGLFMYANAWLYNFEARPGSSKR